MSKHPEANPKPFVLRVKLGAAEFDAEGPEQSVRERFAEFLAAIKNTQQEVIAQSDLPSDRHGPVPLDLLTFFETAKFNANILQIESEAARWLERDADVMLMLMWGYEVLHKRVEVPAGILTRSMELTGRNDVRLDRSLNPDFMESVGKKRGSRYMLNDEGIRMARRWAAFLVDIENDRSVAADRSSSNQSKQGKIGDK